jgi:Putative beta-barrel porin-2, OmpL-like. bbp2
MAVDLLEEVYEMAFRIVRSLIFFSVLTLVPQLARAAEEEKPLAPGWLSLDCCIGPLDKGIASGKGAIQDALGINFGGFLDTSYTWSSNHPKSPANISGRYFDKDHNKFVFNNFHVFVEKPEKDWGVGFRLSGDFGRTGELLREATLWGKTFHREPSAELREAFLTTTIPVGEGIGVKGGLFVTTLGTEILPNPGAYNDNISRSFLFNWSIPLRHLGVSFSYPFHKMLNASAAIVTGWDNPRDNNHLPSFLGTLTFTPTDTVTLVSGIIVGEEGTFADPNRDTARWTWSSVLTLKPMDPLTLYLEYTLGRQHAGSIGGTRSASWQGLAGIASWNWTERFNTAFRAEVFKDRDGARLGGTPSGHANVTLSEFTLTSSYKFTKMLLGRAEVRQDLANESFYRKGATNADSNQTTLAVQLIYAF